MKSKLILFTLILQIMSMAYFYVCILKKLDLYGSETSFPLDYPAEHYVYNVFLEIKHLLIKIFVIGSLFNQCILPLLSRVPVGGSQHVQSQPPWHMQNALAKVMGSQ